MSNVMVTVPHQLDEDEALKLPLHSESSFDVEIRRICSQPIVVTRGVYRQLDGSCIGKGFLDGTIGTGTVKSGDP